MHSAGFPTFDTPKERFHKNNEFSINWGFGWVPIPMTRFSIDGKKLIIILRHVFSILGVGLNGVYLETLK